MSLTVSVSITPQTGKIIVTRPRGENQTSRLEETAVRRKHKDLGTTVFRSLCLGSGRHYFNQSVTVQISSGKPSNFR